MLRSRDLEELEAWLVERALEHEAPKVLFRLARERLRTERLVFPAPDRIVRLVSSARGRAQKRTYTTLVEPLLSAERRAQLGGLLEAKASNSWSATKQAADRGAALKLRKLKREPQAVCGPPPEGDEVSVGTRQRECSDQVIARDFLGKAGQPSQLSL